MPRGRPKKVLDIDSGDLVNPESAQAKAIGAETTKEPATVVKLVKMINIDGKTADVHPDEVENYIKGNYRKV